VLRLTGTVAACVAVAMASPAQAQCAGADPSVPVTVDARPLRAFSPLAPGQRRFGAVEFLGGLELKSSHREFGGFSAIRVEPDGQHFVSLSDRGWWITGRIVYDQGQPAGIADARMAPMLGPDGRTLKARGWWDTESLAERDGWLYVGIERVNRIVRFDFARCAFRARAAEYPAAATAASRPPYFSLPFNKGLEALAFAPRSGRLAGALIAFSERGLDPDGNIRAFLVGGAAPGEFSIKRRDDFDISDSATMPSGDVLLLERRFSWWTGLAVRLRRIAISDVAPGALADGADLLLADMGYEIDNMEGLSVHTVANGVVLTMISDDNFNFLQRTVLLQFRLVEE
jgi:hypothetical protein